MEIDYRRLEAELGTAARLRSEGQTEAAAAVYRGVLRSLAPLPPADLEVVPSNPSSGCLDVAIIEPPGMPMSLVFKEVAESICFGLRELGFDSRITTDLHHRGRRRIVLGSGILPNARRANYPVPLRLRSDTILYQFEQIASPEQFLKSSLLPWFLRFEGWDYSSHNISQLHMAGLQRMKLVPLGYVPQWTRIKDKRKDVDVLFYGHLHDRRKTVIEQLQARGVNARYLVDCFGEERDDWIARSKIVINIHMYGAHVLEYPRVLYLLANGVCVVSETGNDPGEKSLADGIAFASYASLADTCINLLQSPTDREKLSARGFDLIRQRPMVKYLEAALKS